MPYTFRSFRKPHVSKIREVTEGTIELRKLMGWSGQGGITTPFTNTVSLVSHFKRFESMEEIDQHFELDETLFPLIISGIKDRHYVAPDAVQFVLVLLVIIICLWWHVRAGSALGNAFKWRSTSSASVWGSAASNYSWTASLSGYRLCLRVPGPQISRRDARRQFGSAKIWQSKSRCARRRRRQDR